MERRKNPRRKLALAATLQLAFVNSKAAPQKVDVRLLDENEQGLAVSTPVNLAPGTILTIRADATSGAFARLAGCKARVEWCVLDRDGAFQAGLSLLDSPAADDPPAGNLKPEARPEPTTDYYDLLQLSS